MKTYSNWKFDSDGFKGISLEQWEEAYGRWQLIKEMGCQNRMIFYPNGKIGYQSSSPEEEAIVSAALVEWNKRKVIKHLCSYCGDGDHASANCDKLKGKIANAT